MSLASLRKALREDDAYIKYRNILKMAVSNGNFADITSEIESLHKGRLSRRLHLNKPNINTVVDSALQDASYRSRCIEIIIVVSKTQRMLQASVDAIHNHIIAKYSEHLIDIRTKSDREAIVEHLLQPAYNKLTEIERIVEIAQYVVDDIDKAAWSLSNTIKALELMYSRESVIKTGI